MATAKDSQEKRKYTKEVDWEFELANFKDTVDNDVEHEDSDHSNCSHNENDNFSKLEDLNNRMYYLENNLLYSTNGVNYLLTFTYAQHLPCVIYKFNP